MLVENGAPRRAALVSTLRSRYVGYTGDALYVGFYGFDDDSANFMVVGQNFDDDVWREDVIEIFFDADFDHVGLCAGRHQQQSRGGRKLVRRGQEP